MIGNYHLMIHLIEKGRDADAYYRSHHEVDTLIGHSLGGAVALSLEAIQTTR